MEEKDMKFEEIENVEDIENIEDIEETEEETPQRSRIGTIGVLAIGSGLTLGGIALFKKLKKVIAAKRAAKEVAEVPTDEIIEAEIIEAEIDEEPDPKPDTKAEHPKK